MNFITPPSWYQNLKHLSIWAVMNKCPLKKFAGDLTCRHEVVVWSRSPVVRDGHFSHDDVGVRGGMRSGEQHHSALQMNEWRKTEVA